MVDLLLAWLVFGFFGAFICWSLWTAEFRWQNGPRVRRAETPLQYWFWTGLFVLATLLVLMLALTLTLAREPA